MKIKLLSPVIISSILIISCNNKESSETHFSTQADLYEINAQDSVSLAATIQDKTKKFVHTADVNIEVKDVFTSTLSIEKSAVDYGGYIAKSNLKSNVLSNEITPVSKDSAREIKIYNVSNYMEVRIPQPYLRDFLLSINQETDFLNSRFIEATDVTINVKSLELNKKRLENTQNKLDDTLPEGKTKDKHTIINSIDNVQSEKDQTILSKDILNDKIKFATVTIFLQQKDQIKQSVIANTKDYSLYAKSDFGYKMKSAFINGFHIFQSVLVSLFYLWPFWLLAIIGFILYKKLKSKKTKV